MTEVPQSRTLRSTGSWAPPQDNVVTERRRPPFDPRFAIAAILFVVIIGLAVWYLARPEPLLVQGEAVSTRTDIAARVSGRLAKIEVHRGQNVAAGATLLVIDNPELVAQLHEDEAKKAIADAELQRIMVGTRAEIIAQRKAEIDRATADWTLAQQTYNRTKQLAADKFAPQSKLDEDTDALVLSQRRLYQAKLAYDEAVRGFTAISSPCIRRVANCRKGRAS
jgi:HlyD family secretion protein